MLFVPDCWRIGQSLSSFPGADRSFRPTSQRTSLVFVTFWRPPSKLEDSEMKWSRCRKKKKEKKELNVMKPKRIQWTQCEHLVYFGLGCLNIDDIVYESNSRSCLITELSNMSLVSVQLSICSREIVTSLISFFQNDSSLQSYDTKSGIYGIYLDRQLTVFRLCAHFNI